MVGWANIFYFSSMDRISNFVIDLLRPFIKAQRTISCPTIFTQWYFAFVNILKGNVIAFLDSTTRCPYFCLISFPIPCTKDWKFKKNTKSIDTKNISCKNANQFEKIRTT